MDHFDVGHLLLVVAVLNLFVVVNQVWKEH
jgi:hypothetical protein